MIEPSPVLAPRPLQIGSPLARTLHDLYLGERVIIPNEPDAEKAWQTIADAVVEVSWLQLKWWPATIVVPPPEHQALLERMASRDMFGAASFGILTSDQVIPAPRFGGYGVLAVHPQVDLSALVEQRFAVGQLLFATEPDEVTQIVAGALLTADWSNAKVEAPLDVLLAGLPHE